MQLKASASMSPYNTFNVVDTFHKKRQFLQCSAQLPLQKMINFSLLGSPFLPLW